MPQVDNRIQELTNNITTMMTSINADEDMARALDCYDRLGDAYFERSRLTQSNMDRLEADSLTKKAIQLWDNAAADRPSDASSCWQAFRFKKQYERFRRPEDLDRAISLYADGLPHLAGALPGKEYFILAQAKCLCDRFDLGGNGQDIVDAAGLYGQVDEITGYEHQGSSSDDDGDVQAVLHIGKSAMFLSRYERWNSSKDLREAVRQAQLAVDLTPEDHGSMATRLATYAMSRRKLWEAKQKHKDLELALQLLERAKTISTGMDGRQFVLCQLAKAKYCKYKVTRNMFDKADAFEAGKEAWRESMGCREDMKELIKEIAFFLNIQNGNPRSPDDIMQEILEQGEAALHPY